jgi:uncharacterized protein
VIPARITVVTLGVRDLKALRDFYVGLGWELAVDLDDFCAFATRGAVLTLYLLDQLVADGRTQPAPEGPGMRGFTLAINVDEREQVDETMAAAERAGGRVTKPPVTAEWGGRSGYFADPEENYWEVAWVPPDTTVAQLIERASG